MNIVIVTQKPIQTLSLLYLLGGIGVFPVAVVFVHLSTSHKEFGLMDESSSSLDALRFQCGILNIAMHTVEDIQAASSIDLLKGLNTDLYLSLVTDTILKNDFIGTAKYGVVSSHGGILPKYRGNDCLYWAILNGEKYVGISTQLIDSGVDTGDIISTCMNRLADLVPTSVGELNKVMFYQSKLYAFLDPVVQLINNGEIAVTHQRLSEGKQYFAMHQELKEMVDSVLSK